MEDLFDSSNKYYKRAIVEATEIASPLSKSFLEQRE